MKKSRPIALLLGVLILASMTSCTKEGVYTPKKKIQRVYFSSTNTDKYLCQSWDWDDNLLEAINFYSSSGSSNGTENFSYDGKRLIRVDDYLNSEYTTYDYDGKNLKSANYYYKNALEVTATYDYSDGKLNKIVLTEYGGWKFAGECHMQLSYLPFTKDFAEVITKIRAKVAEYNSSKSIYVLNLQLTWSGDNISKIVATTSEGRIGTVTLQYDSKNNPFKGFLHLYSFDVLGDVEGGDLFMSKNNITSAISSFEGENYVFNFNYQYDGDDYPTMRIDPDSQSIHYYEYK